MPARLPGWVWGGAWSLACIAGMVNVTGFLGFAHQAITHLTGTTSQLGEGIARGDLHVFGRALGGIAGFLAGAVLGGLIIQNSTLKLGRRYGVALAIESMLLFACVPLFQHRFFAGPILAAMACGLQNAMATTFSDTVVRTTHLSGMFTDLGIGLGHALRGMSVPPRRLWLSVVVISGFATGGAIGTRGFLAWGYDALFVPAALTGLVGIGYVTWRHLQLVSARRTP